MDGSKLYPREYFIDNMQSDSPNLNTIINSIESSMILLLIKKYPDVMSEIANIQNQKSMLHTLALFPLKFSKDEQELAIWLIDK